MRGQGGGRDYIVSSELAYGELFSALLRKERTGVISQEDEEVSWAEFEQRIAEQSLWLAKLDGATIRRGQGPHA